VVGSLDETLAPIWRRRCFRGGVIENENVGADSASSAWAAIATLNGLPATTMPNGRSESGLPIGVQIVGGYLEDRSTIAFAGLIEREFGGFTPPPI